MGKRKRPDPIKYSIEIGKNEKLVIEADEVFSSNGIAVKQGQKYHITCDKDERWYDLYVRSSALGYFNPLALLAGMRVKNTKCYCLCGAYDRQDKTGFRIGLEKTIQIAEDFEELNFFANDTKHFYWNNFGRITIQVTRLE
jgi:hypothetical protein